MGMILRQVEHSMKIGGISSGWVSSMILEFDRETRRVLLEKDKFEEVVELAGDDERIRD